MLKRLNIIMLLVVTAFMILLFFSCGNDDDPVVPDDEEPDTVTVTDIDGHIYQTIQIGDQRWMAENLKVTRYRNGVTLPLVTSNVVWESLSTAGYSNYNNDIANAAIYGRLYNWSAVNDSRNLAPEGWHVPSRAEWQTLIDYLGGASIAGGKMKEVGTLHWLSPNAGATDESGFSARPGGCRDWTGHCTNIFFYAYFWSSTEINDSEA